MPPISGTPWASTRLHIQLVYSAGGVAACDKADAGVLLFFRQGAVDNDDLHMEAPFPFSFSGGYYIRYPGEFLLLILSLCLLTACGREPEEPAGTAWTPVQMARARVLVRDDEQRRVLPPLCRGGSLRDRVLLRSYDRSRIVDAWTSGDRTGLYPEDLEILAVLDQIPPGRCPSGL